MYNSDIPTRAELPSSAQLIKSTILAIVAAAVILVTLVLPAEYAIDPTGIGRALKLTQMGEIKNQLAAEAEADRQMDRQRQQQVPAPGQRSSLPQIIASWIVSPASAGTSMLAQATERSDETVITLQPAEGVEWKMRMSQGAQARYAWTVQGGSVNYDMHGTPASGAKETSYKSGRAVPKDEGTLTAAYDGSHGWFFRNRGNAPVTITLKTSGSYTDLKRLK
jgi:hypothetical protein